MSWEKVAINSSRGGAATSAFAYCDVSRSAATPFPMFEELILPIRILQARFPLLGKQIQFMLPGRLA